MVVSSTIQKIKKDICLITLILLFQHIVYYFIYDKELFSYSWIIFTLSWIIAIIIYYITLFRLFNKIEIKLIKLMKLFNINYNKINIILILTKDIIKFSFIYLTRDIIYNIVLNKSLDSNNLYDINYIYTILGYTIYNIINYSIPNINSKWQHLYNDTIKTTCGEISRNILADSNFNFEHLISLTGILLGILIYHIIF